MVALNGIFFKSLPVTELLIQLFENTLSNSTFPEVVNETGVGDSGAAEARVTLLVEALGCRQGIMG